MGIQNAAKFDSCRPTACISRRRENEAAERERALAGSKTEDRPAYAGRLHAFVRRRRKVCLLTPTECPDRHAPRHASAPTVWLRRASTPCSWLQQACAPCSTPLWLRMISRVRRSPRVPSAPTVGPDGHELRAPGSDRHGAGVPGSDGHKPRPASAPTTASAGEESC
jgi:hypothetical protein